ncbi:unnamed protein product [Trypanosoma congolense IL3000]|uniref:WGS project CAEQ00000000 data, annotated contig 1429 n=1 Tax=Trypanosoma congolense (strain IL3000) TaxID=1068625 RepID=F9W672_TRYCI|nr:unnamed protein product [Trypanosoma congolense IL3000]
MEGSVQDALLRSKVLEEFESIVFVLYSLLSHCSTSGTCDVDEEIPMLASELVFAALKTSPDGLSTLFALPSNDALLLLPLHTRIICSIVGLLQQDHAVLRDLARILWTDHHILQRLSRVLCELGEAEEEQELRSTIYSLVLRLCTLCNTNVSTRGDGTDDIVSAFSLDVGYLLSFAAEHLLAGCWLQLSSCRSLFIHLCMHAPFRHGMHALHGEAYRMALMLVAEDSGQAGEKSLVDQWAKERSDDTLSELRA